MIIIMIIILQIIIIMIIIIILMIIVIMIVIIMIVIIIIVIIIRRPLGAHGCEIPCVKTSGISSFKGNEVTDLEDLKVREYMPLRSQLPRLQMTTVLSLVLKPREGCGVDFAEYPGHRCSQNLPGAGGSTLVFYVVLGRECSKNMYF